MSPENNRFQVEPLGAATPQDQAAWEDELKQKQREGTFDVRRSENQGMGLESDAERQRRLFERKKSLESSRQQLTVLKDRLNNQRAELSNDDFNRLVDAITALQTEISGNEAMIEMLSEMDGRIEEAQEAIRVGLAYQRERTTRINELDSALNELAVEKKQKEQQLAGLQGEAATTSQQILSLDQQRQEAIATANREEVAEDWSTHWVDRAREYLDQQEAQKQKLVEIQQKMESAMGEISEVQEAISALSEHYNGFIDEIKAEAQAATTDAARRLQPGGSPRPLEASVPDLGVGGGTDESATEVSIPLGERTPEEAPEAAGKPSVELPPPLPSVPELPPEPSNEPIDEGANMDNEGRVENPPHVELPGPGDLVSEPAATPEPANEPAMASGFDRQFSRRQEAPGLVSNQAVTELGIMLGGIPDSLVRQAVRDLLRSRPTSETGSDITDELVDRVAGMALDTANRLGYKPNPGESAVDFLNRVNEESERRNMSLWEKISAAIPQFRIELPRIGASPEQRRATLEARLQDINDKLLSGDFSQAYDANGILRPLSAEERANARRKLEAERDQLQKQLDALPTTESGEAQPREYPGKKLWGWFKNLRNIPGNIAGRLEERATQRAAEQTQRQEATDELGRRLDLIDTLNQRVREFAGRNELFTAGAIDALLNAYRTLFDIAGLDADQRRQYETILGRNTEEIPVIESDGDGNLRLEMRDLTMGTDLNEMRDNLGRSLRNIQKSKPRASVPFGQPETSRGAQDLRGVIARSSQPLEQRFGKEIADILNAL